MQELENIKTQIIYDSINKFFEDYYSAYEFNNSLYNELMVLTSDVNNKYRFYDCVNNEFLDPNITKFLYLGKSFHNYYFVWTSGSNYNDVYKIFDILIAPRITSKFLKNNKMFDCYNTFDCNGNISKKSYIMKLNNDLDFINLFNNGKIQVGV